MSGHKLGKPTIDEILVLTDCDRLKNRVSRSDLILVAMMLCLAGCVPSQNSGQDLIQEQSRIGDTEDISSQRDITARRVDSLPVSVNIMGDVRSESFVKTAMTKVTDIYQQCGLSLSIEVNSRPEESTTDLSEGMLNFYGRQHASYPPTVYVVESTLERDVAFSYLPSLNRDISGTAWITNRVSDACFAWVVAHEIGHIALDSSAHHPDKRNVMNRFCSGNSNFNRRTALPRWDEQQCAVLSDYFTIDR